MGDGVGGVDPGGLDLVAEVIPLGHWQALVVLSAGGAAVGCVGELGEFGGFVEVGHELVYRTGAL